MTQASPLSGIIIKDICSKRDLADYFCEFSDRVGHGELLAHYIGETSHGRAEVFQALNCAAREHNAVIAEFSLIQRQWIHSKRGRTVYHFVLSRRGKTDPQILVAMAKRCLALAGLDQQKAIIAVHTDTDDHHVHVAVSAIDANGRQIILEEGHTHVLLAHINAQLCHEFGFEPEAGLGFYANDKGVFRTADDNQMRDAAFVKVTKDLRKEPARTELSRKNEQLSGAMSNQRVAQANVEYALRHSRIGDVLAELAAEGLGYHLKGSGASISFRGEWFKASEISRHMSPKKLAARFGLSFVDEAQAARTGIAVGAGFYERDTTGVLRKVRLPRALPESFTFNPPLTGAQSRRRFGERNVEARMEHLVPPPAPSHTLPLQVREREILAATYVGYRWQIDRLRRAAWDTEARRGRPPKATYEHARFDAPRVALANDKATLLGPPHYNPWLAIRWSHGLTVRETTGAQTVYRGKTPLVTFSRGMVTIHEANEADRRHILRLASNHFGEDITVFGRPRECRLLTQIAASEGITFLNPELGPLQKHLLRTSQNALSKISQSLDAAVLATQERCAIAMRSIDDALSQAARTMVHSSLEAGREALARLVFPDRPTAMRVGEARLEALGTRLSVQHERMRAEAMKAEISVDPTAASPVVTPPVSRPEDGAIQPTLDATAVVPVANSASVASQTQAQGIPVEVSPSRSQAPMPEASPKPPSTSTTRVLHPAERQKAIMPARGERTQDSRQVGDWIASQLATLPATRLGDGSVEAGFEVDENGVFVPRRASVADGSAERARLDPKVVPAASTDWPSAPELRETTATPVDATRPAEGLGQSERQPGATRSFDKPSVIENPVPKGGENGANPQEPPHKITTKLQEIAQQGSRAGSAESAASSLLVPRRSHGGPANPDPAMASGKFGGANDGEPRPNPVVTHPQETAPVVSRQAPNASEYSHRPAPAVKTQPAEPQAATEASGAPVARAEDQSGEQHGASRARPEVEVSEAAEETQRRRFEIPEDWKRITMIAHSLCIKPISLVARFVANSEPSGKVDTGTQACLRYRAQNWGQQANDWDPREYRRTSLAETSSETELVKPTPPSPPQQVSNAAELARWAQLNQQYFGR